MIVRYINVHLIIIIIIIIIILIIVNTRHCSNSNSSQEHVTQADSEASTHCNCTHIPAGPHTVEHIVRLSINITHIHIPLLCLAADAGYINND